MAKNVVKCCLVGDAMVGKTAVVKAFLDKELQPYTPTVFDNYAGQISYEGAEWTISIFDLPGNHDHRDLRRFAYAESQCFIVFYSSVHRKSFQNVTKFWLPELKKYVRRKPLLVLVDTHCELRNTVTSETDTPVSIEEGFSMTQEIEAVSFIECGTLSKETSRKIFTDAVINTVMKRKKKTSKLLNLFKK
ncbi:hypothetical protein ACJMK2_036378 [Sinanodonta woodiana]|uniref:Uncharacterized protein n=1 Tax=Sinanodonta woodiana TaxID=1069815 RepID=A0ABD3WKK7_SINWO